jgi:hypothetical protein
MSMEQAIEYALSEEEPSAVPPVFHHGALVAFLCTGASGWTYF